MLRAAKIPIETLECPGGVKFQIRMGRYENDTTMTFYDEEDHIIEIPYGIDVSHDAAKYRDARVANVLFLFRCGVNYVISYHGAPISTYAA